MTLKQIKKDSELARCYIEVDNLKDDIKQARKAGMQAMSEAEKDKWLGFFREDIESCFIPKCHGCGKIATEQTAKGEYAQKNNHRPVNWGYYCKKCYQEGLEMEHEAMYA